MESHNPIRQLAEPSDASQTLLPQSVAQPAPPMPSRAALRFHGIMHLLLVALFTYYIKVSCRPGVVPICIGQLACGAALAVAGSIYLWLAFRRAEVSLTAIQIAKGTLAAAAIVMIVGACIEFYTMLTRDR